MRSGPSVAGQRSMAACGAIGPAAAWLGRGIGDGSIEGDRGVGRADAAGAG